jgi:hypothetical protein
MLKVVALVAALIAALGVYVYVTEGQPTAADLPPATAIDPPAGAVMLPDGMRAGDVLRPVLTLKEQDDIDAAKADFVGAWTPLHGWTGGVKRVEVRAASTWFSVEMFDSTILGQQFYVEVEVPGGLPQIRPGVSVTFRGRVKDIIPTPDPVLIPGRVVLDQGTVLVPAR